MPFCCKQFWFSCDTELICQLHQLQFHAITVCIENSNIHDSNIEYFTVLFNQHKRCYTNVYSAIPVVMQFGKKTCGLTITLSQFNCPQQDGECHMKNLPLPPPPLKCWRHFKTLNMHLSDSSNIKADKSFTAFNNQPTVYWRIWVFISLSPILLRFSS